MKAVVFEEHGGIDKLKYVDVGDPLISASEVLIRVRASACNYNDIWARRGLPGMKIALPHISGSDVAGEVLEVGPLADSGIEVGQEVIIHPGLSCRKCEFCTSGQEYFCRQYKIYGFQTGPLDGGHAELVKVPDVNVLLKPKHLPFEEAASLPLVLMTAWHMLVSRAHIHAGDYVLVWGAAGGLGSMAIQIAKNFGATVIGVAGSDRKLEKARELGADYVINHTSANFLEEVRRITERRGVDVVFEHPGQSTWERSIQSLRWGGTLVVCGATTGFEAKTDLRFLWNKQLNLLGCHMGTKAELLEALKFVEADKIKPILHHVLPLSQAAKAQQMMEEREVVGKIVLKP